MTGNIQIDSQCRLTVIKLIRRMGIPVQISQSERERERERERGGGEGGGNAVYKFTFSPLSVYC